VVEPRGSKTVTLQSSKTTAYVYAELDGGDTAWGDGDISRTVISQAFSYFDGENCPKGTNRRTIKLTKYAVKNGAIDFRPKNAASDAPLETAGDAAGETKPAARSGKRARRSDDTGVDAELRKATDEMISLVNRRRRLAGAKTVTRDDTLCEAAQRRAYEIKDDFSHTRPDGRQAITVLKEYGISVNSFGENLEKDNAASVVFANDALYDSPDHRATMLSAKYTHIGVGLFAQDGYYYWVQLYGDEPAPVSPDTINNKSLEESIDDFIKSINELGDLFK
jgi:uncharacterized protein YkwD